MKVLDSAAKQGEASAGEASGQAIAGGRARGESDLLDTVRAMAPEIAARAEETEQNRGMAPDLIAKLRAAGLFRMMIPKAFGGLELNQLQAARVIEELAKADGSAGWNAMVIFGFNVGFGRFPRKVLDEVFAAGPDVVCRGALAPLGSAVPAEGGYVFNGQWPFASGSFTPEWIIASALIMEGGQPKIGPAGAPEFRMALVPGDKAEFLDTWRTMGLAGSASHDFVLKDVFVPEAYTTNFFDPTLESAFRTPLLQLPFQALTGPTHSAVAIGIAEGAIQEVATLASSKRSAFNPRATLVEDPVFRYRLGEASARLFTLRAAMDQQVETTWRRAVEGAPLTPLMFAEGSAVVSYTHHACVEIVNELFALMGSTPVYSKLPLQRRWRDVRAAAQHIGASQGAYNAYGALLAGVDPGPGRH